MLCQLQSHVASKLRVNLISATNYMAIQGYRKISRKNNYGEPQNLSTSVMSGHSKWAHLDYGTECPGFSSGWKERRYFFFSCHHILTYVKTRIKTASI
jgi:hypothetical protein